MEERKKVGIIRDAASMRLVAVVLEILRTCDADLVALQRSARTRQAEWDIGSIRARLERVRVQLVQGVAPEK